MGYALYYSQRLDNAAIDTFKRFKSEVIDTITGYKLPVITLTFIPNFAIIKQCVFRSDSSTAKLKNFKYIMTW